jgi:hypothetical protein
MFAEVDLVTIELDGPAMPDGGEVTMTCGCHSVARKQKRGYFDKSGFHIGRMPDLKALTVK